MIKSCVFLTNKKTVIHVYTFCTYIPFTTLVVEGMFSAEQTFREVRQEMLQKSFVVFDYVGFLKMGVTTTECYKKEGNYHE